MTTYSNTPFSVRCLLFLYNATVVILTPALWALLRYRRFIGKEHPQRWPEKMAQTGLNPKVGAPLLWCHAASVGEAKSVLPLLNAFIESHPTWQILITTVTRTAFNTIEKQLGPQMTHQFAPLDHPLWVKRFLNHWQPQAALWVEGELWPNQLFALKKRSTPIVFINGRMHPKSFARWQHWPKIIGAILNCFTAGTAMSPRSANYYRNLGLLDVQVLGDLKMASPKLLTPAHGLSTLQEAMGHRPRLLLAQSHAGEETLLLKNFRYLEKQFPQLLLTIAPRHPARSAEIVQMINDEGLSFETRGDQHRLPSATTQVYLANTMGELGLFYETHDVIVMGGSFIGLGGHNPVEPAHFGCHIITGPNMFNFEHMVALLEPSGAIQSVSEAGLPLLLSTILAQPKTALATGAEKIRRLAEQQQTNIIPNHLRFLNDHIS